MNPTSVYINLGTSEWEIPHALPDDEEKLNVYNMAVAVSARGFEYYAGMMDQMMDEIQHNTLLLNEVNAMKDWQLSDWSNQATAIQRTDVAESLGFTGDTHATFQYGSGSNYLTALATYPPTAVLPTTGSIPRGLYYNADVPPEVVFSNGTTVYGTRNIQTYNSRSLADVTFTAADGSVGTERRYLPPKIYDLPYPGDGGVLDVAALNRPDNFEGYDSGLFLSRDNVLFRVGGGTHAQVTSIKTFFVPTAEELDTWKGEIKDNINQLTQLSQQQQVQLQDLIASYNKFMNFASNVMERKERDLQGIADRF
jgi:hypothetical protein